MSRAAANPLVRVGVGLIVLSACGAGDKADPATNGMSPTTVTVDTTPVLVLPSIGPDDSVNFGSARSVALLGNGEIAVADPSIRAVRLFSPNGRLVRTIGRPGEGPGEFQYMSWVRECRPDTLFVADDAQGRVSLFGTDGRFIRQHPFRVGAGSTSCDSTGQLIRLDLIGSPGMPGDQSPLYLGTVSLVGFDQPDRVLDTIPVFLNRPMGQQSWIAVANGSIAVGRGDSALVNFMSASGAHLARHALGTAGRAPTAAQYQAEIDRWLRMLSRPEDRVRPREILMRIPAPATMPAFRAILADPTGAVWAVTSPAGEPVTVLEGFDSLGRPLPSLRLPGDLDVHAVGRDHVLAIAEDADGAQRIIVFKLTRKN